MPASTMNTTITHWLAALNASTDLASGEKPPVGSVVKACATALNGSMRSSIPVQPKIARISACAAVRAT